MAVTSIRYTTRVGPMNQIVGGITDKAAYRAAQKMRGRVQKNIHAKGRVDTHAMVNGIQVRVLAKAGLGAAYQVYSTATYTAFQEYGTRAHGPRVAKVMVFTPKGGGGLVFAKWVRGVTPGHFFRDAMRDARAADAEP
jgi:hypothetical protein